MTDPIRYLKTLSFSPGESKRITALSTRNTTRLVTGIFIDTKGKKTKLDFKVAWAGDNAIQVFQTSANTIVIPVSGLGEAIHLPKSSRFDMRFEEESGSAHDVDVHVTGMEVLL